MSILTPPITVTYPSIILVKQGFNVAKLPKLMIIAKWDYSVIGTIAPIPYFPADKISHLDAIKHFWN
jgi:hypothetical protein